MIHPPLGHPGRLPREEGAGWNGPVVLSLLVTGLGALVGSIGAALLRANGGEWSASVLTPLTALAAATSIYSQFRDRPVGWHRARAARLMVSGAATLLVTGVVLGEPGLTVVSLWAMTGATVGVTALAAGAGSEDEFDSAWVRRPSTLDLKSP